MAADITDSQSIGHLRTATGLASILERRFFMRGALRRPIVPTLLSPGAAMGADNQLTDAEKDAGWQLLFNGKDLTGSRRNNDRPIATKIEDGCLVPYQSGGYLIIHEGRFA